MSELAKQQTASQAKAIEKTFNTTSDNEQEACSDNNNIRGCSFLSKHSAGDQIHYFSPIKKNLFSLSEYNRIIVTHFPNLLVHTSLSQSRQIFIGIGFLIRCGSGLKSPNKYF